MGILLSPAAPTPSELLARLKEVTGATSDEDLARQLDVTLSSLNRWKRGRTMRWETAWRLLQRAGYVSVDDDADERARQRQVEHLVEEVAKMSRVVERLQELQRRE